MLNECFFDDNVMIYRANFNELYTQGNNTLLQHAMDDKNSNVVIIMNPDITFDEPIFEKIYNKIMSDNKIGIIGVKLLYPKSNTIEHAGCIDNKHIGYGEINNKKFDIEEEVEWVTGAVLVTRRDVIEKVGYLDSSFTHWGSDQEFCRRIKHFGYKVLYYPIEVYHNQGTSSSEYSRHYGVTKNIKPGVFPNLIQIDPDFIKEKAFYNYLVQSLMTMDEKSFHSMLREYSIKFQRDRCKVIKPDK